MLTLVFNVEGQRLSNSTKRPIVVGSQGYVEARFNFSNDWSGFNKVASFYDVDGEEYPVIIQDGKCRVPDVVLKNRMFKVKVTGKKGDAIMPSTRVVVRQVV